MPDDDPTPAVRGPTPVVLVPRVAEGGRYHRRQVANARLEVADGALVVTDAGRQSHRFPFDGSPGEPAAVGVIVNLPGAHRESPFYFVVVDRRSYVLVRDGAAGIWHDDDVRRFATRAGLRHLPREPFEMGLDQGRPPVDLRPVPWVPAVLACMVPVVGAGLALTGAGGVVTGVVVVAFVVLVLLSTRIGTAHLEPAAAPSPVSHASPGEPSGGPPAAPPAAMSAEPFTASAGGPTSEPSADASPGVPDEEPRP